MNVKTNFVSKTRAMPKKHEDGQCPNTIWEGQCPKKGTNNEDKTQKVRAQLKGLIYKKGKKRVMSLKEK